MGLGSLWIKKETRLIGSKGLTRDIFSSRLRLWAKNKDGLYHFFIIQFLSLGDNTVFSSSISWTYLIKLEPKERFRDSQRIKHYKKN